MGSRNLVWLGAMAGMALSAGAATGQEAVDWSGFYAGVYAGYGLGADAGTASATTVSADLGGGTTINGNFSESDGRISGLIGGGLVGYNFQRDRLVLGVEGGLNLGQYGKSQTSMLNGTLAFGVDSITLVDSHTADYAVNWYADLAGRVGIAHENWLFTLKGGVVVADASIAATSSLVATSAPPPGINFNVGGSSSTNAVLIGPTFGIGVEHMIATNISLTAEYSYVGLPDLSAPAAGLGGGLGGALLGIGGITPFSGAIHQAKLGAKYHF